MLSYNYPVAWIFLHSFEWLPQYLYFYYSFFFLFIGTFKHFLLFFKSCWKRETVFFLLPSKKVSPPDISTCKVWAVLDIILTLFTKFLKCRKMSIPRECRAVTKKCLWMFHGFINSEFFQTNTMTQWRYY